jgi:hypothetical protein
LQLLLRACAGQTPSLLLGFVLIIAAATRLGVLNPCNIPDLVLDLPLFHGPSLGSLPLFSDIHLLRCQLFLETRIAIFRKAQECQLSLSPRTISIIESVRGPLRLRSCTSTELSAGWLPAFTQATRNTRQLRFLHEHRVTRRSVLGRQSTNVCPLSWYTALVSART